MPAQTGERRFSLATGIFEIVPDYRRAIAVGRRDRTADLDAIREGLAAASLMRRSEGGAVTDIAAIQRWRRAYRAVGLNPTKTRPAVEAVIRRARRDGAPSLGRPPIDAGTIVTLLAGVPVGVHALDQIRGELTLDFAEGDESFTTLQGDSEHPQPGELVWRAGKTILTRRWVHKQGAAGSVTDASASFAVNLDLLDGDDLHTAGELLLGWLRLAGITVSGVVVLDRAGPARTMDVPDHAQA